VTARTTDPGQDGLETPGIAELEVIRMEESDAVTEALLRFYDRRSAADVSSFDGLVSRELSIMLGTGPDEWFEDREVLRRHFGVQAFTMEPGTPRGWSEGGVGWALDTPRLVFGGGQVLHTRLTMLMCREDDEWKMIHAHFSVEVPDELAFTLSSG
jgi:hypothetical protein